MARSTSASQVLVLCASFALLTSLVAQAAIISAPNGVADFLPAVDVASEPSSLGHGPVHSRKLLSSPTYQQQVEDAVLKTFDYLIGSNSGARNPLQTLDVPCQEFQLKGALKDGPYYLTAVFQFTSGPDLPILLRTCKFKPGVPVLVTIGDVICTALCSAQTGKCDCCDGTVNTADPADPSNPAVCPVTARTECSYCDDATDLGYFSDYLNSPASSATLTDLSTGATTALQPASVSVGPGHPIQLTPNSYYRSPDVGITYGPDAVMSGPPLYVGQFALIDPALLLPGHTYRVATTFPGYNNGHPVVYQIEMHRN